MKLINKPVEAQTDVERLPVSILWNGRWHAVISIDSTWLVQGQWWTDAQRKGRSRWHYRVTLDTNRSVELTKEDGVWRVFRVLD